MHNRVFGLDRYYIIDAPGNAFAVTRIPYPAAILPAVVGTGFGGLASLSSNRVRVESLFIDEGFGSLDAETLRVAMDALDSLQAMGRKNVKPSLSLLRLGF